MRKLLSIIIQPLFFIAVGVVARVLPHPANFAPIAAMALFGGTYMSKKQALAIPVAAMFISDFIVGFDSLPMRLTVYGSFMAIVFVGFWLKGHKNVKHIVLATFFSSVLFFITTNFAVWLFGTMYSKSFSGLAECYILAIPFFKNTLLGDFFYTGLFYGGYEFTRSLVKHKKLALSS